MRRVNTTLVLILIAAAAFAGSWNASELVLTTFGHQSFRVEIDGQRYHANDLLEIQGLSPGVHYLRVDRRVPNSCGYGGQGTILYNGRIDIPANSRVEAHITHRRQLMMDVIALHTPCGMGCAPSACTCGTQPPVYTDPYGQGQSCGTSTGYGYYDDLYYGGYTGYTGYPGYGGYTGYGGQVGYGNYPVQGSCGVGNSSGYGNWTPVMSQQDFTEFRRNLQRISFESTQLQAVEQQLSFARFTSDQTRILMNLFSFDSSRLELAKMIYPSVVDPQRFFIVADGFTFDSTRNELHAFMQY